MTLTFSPITLDNGDDDSDAVLALRDGRLAAVLTRLGSLHDELADRWFVESTFNSGVPAPRQTFESLDDFADWLLDAHSRSTIQSAARAE